MKLSVMSKLALIVVSGAIGITGCGKPTTDSAKAKPGAHSEDHEHAEEGPHHGHLIELGEEEFHAEVVEDDAAGKVTIYLLDKSAKAPVSADNDQVLVSLLLGGQPKQFVMKATNATKKDQFDSNEKELVEALDHDKAAKGRLHVTIGGKPYIGTIDHHEHGEHSHK